MDRTPVSSSDELFESVRELCHKTGLVRLARGYDPLLTREDVDQIIRLSIIEATRNYSELKNLKSHTNRHRQRRKKADLRSVAYIYAKKNLMEVVRRRAGEIERFIVTENGELRVNEIEYFFKHRRNGNGNGNGNGARSHRMVISMEDLRFEDGKKTSDELLLVDETFTEYPFTNGKSPEELLIEKEENEDDLFSLS